MNPAFEKYRSELMAGAVGFDLQLSEAQINQLLTYLELLCKWNKAYNLTAVRDPDEMLSRHLLDSLSVVPFVTADRVLDVGTGPGLPGIPLAICYPDREFTLLDSNGKKTRFLTQCKMQMGLKNMTVVHGRAEQHQPASPYDQITSRAFSALKNIIQWCEHLLSDKGQFLAMKGLYPDDEIAEMPSHYQVTRSEVLTIPGCVGERHLLWVTRKNI